MRDVSMTLSQIELALLGGLPLHKLDQLIASRCAPIYARPQSRRVACSTLPEAVMRATGMMLHERYGLGWPLIHHAIALNPELFVDPLDEADGATELEERWLAVYDEPRSASARLGIWMNGWEGLFLAVRRMGCFRAGCEFGTEPAHAPQPRQRPHPCDRHRRDPSRRGPASRPPAPAPERVRRPRRCPRALARALPPP